MSAKEKLGIQKSAVKEEKSGSFFSFAISLTLLIFSVLAFKDFILDANNIPSGSMVPTLKIGDYLFVNKMRYSIRIPFLGKEIVHIDDPKRGDIITFAPFDEKNKHYVKRVMAMPYDRIRIRDISGCEIRRQKEKEQGAKTSPVKKNSFACKGGFRALHEPLVSILEYRVNDMGPWKRYPIEELPIEISHKELLDSDNHGVLPPEYIKHREYYSYSPPVVYREKVGESEHFIVESAKSTDARELCDTIYTKGCLVPLITIL